MIRRLNMFSWLLLSAATAGLVLMSTASLGGSISTSSRPLVFSNFPAGQARTIEFDTTSPSYAELSPREKAEQDRDWLLYAVASTATAPAVDVEQALYDVPPIRTDALAQVSQAETGETRGRMLGSKDLIAIMPKAAADRQADYLADVADEQRKNTGQIPERIHVFEYELTPGRESGWLTYRGPTPGAQLFDTEAGYIERTIGSISDLADFLQGTDDLVSARISDGKLIAGGRRFRTRHQARIGVEEVASIWQSSVHDSNKLGFSLDPEIDYAVLRTKMAQIGVTTDDASSPLGALDSRLPDLNNLLRRKQKASDPLEEYRAAFNRHFAERGEDLLNQLFRGVVMSCRFQKARYDGDFQGTEVGMVLFYTDLLMKLWGQDRLNSTPTAVPEFPNRLKLNPDSLYKAETTRLSETRLWLGPRESSLQKDSSHGALYLARVATRLFAVPHDSLGNTDLKEAEPNVFNRAYIDWWNRHYAEVAAYEPQYERLNAIMKWSEVIGWLHSQDAADKLSMLRAGEVRVHSDYWFPDWAKSKPGLTFQKWDQLEFYEKGHSGADTESMQIQVSRTFTAFGEDGVHFSGGVSLGGSKAMQDLPALENDLAVAARRGGMTSSHDEGVWKLTNKTGTIFETKPLDTYVARSSVKIGESVRLRGTAAEFKTGPFERRMSIETDGAVVQCRLGDSPVGELRLNTTGNGLKASWHARDIDTGYTIAREISASPEPERALLSHPEVALVVQRDPSSYMIQLRGSGQWIRVARSQSGEQVAEASFGRVSGGPTAPIMDATLIPRAGIEAELKSLGYVEIRTSPSDVDGVLLINRARPPPEAQPVSLEIGGKPLQAFRQGDRTLVRWASLPDDVRANPGRIGESLRLSEAGFHPFPSFEDFASRSYGRLAAAAEKDPRAFYRSVNESIDGNLRGNQELLLEGKLERVQQQIAFLEGYVGDLPELRLQSAVAHIENGKVDAAVRVIESNGGRPPLRDTGLLGEIEARLNDPRVGALERESLESVRDYTRYSSQLRGRGLLGAENERGALRLRFEVPELKKVTLSGDSPALDQGAIFLEEGLGLNSSDVNPATVRSTVHDWIRAGRVDVYAIQDIDLAGFRPSVLVEAKSQTQYRLASKSTWQVHAPDANQCRGGDRNDPSCQSVIVRERKNRPVARL